MSQGKINKLPTVTNKGSTSFFAGKSEIWDSHDLQRMAAHQENLDPVKMGHEVSTVTYFMLKLCRYWKISKELVRVE